MRYVYRYMIGAALLLTIPLVSAESPEDLPVITRNNAAQVVKLASAGSDHVIDLAWSPDGTQLAVLGKNQLALYDAHDLSQPPQILDSLPCDTKDEFDEPCEGSVQYIPEKNVLLAVYNNHLRTFDSETGQPLIRYNITYPDGDYPYHLSGGVYNNEKNLLVIASNETGNYGSLVMLPGFDLTKSMPEPQDARFYGWPDDATKPDMRLFIYGAWSGLAISPDANYIAASSLRLEVRMMRWPGGDVLLYDIKTALEAPLKEFQEQEEQDGSLYETRLTGHDQQVRQMAFSPDGTLLASAALDTQIGLWDMPQGTLRHMLQGHYGAVWDVDFDPTGHYLVSSGIDGAVIIWDVAQERPLHTVRGLGAAINAVAYSEDGTRVAAGGENGSLWIFDAKSTDVLDTRAGHWGTTSTIAFHPESTLLAAGNDNNDIVLYTLMQQEPYITERMTLYGHRGPITALLFDPTGRHLMSGSTDGAIIIWDVATGEIIDQMQTDPVRTIERLGYDAQGACIYKRSTNAYGAIYGYSPSMIISESKPGALCKDITSDQDRADALNQVSMNGYYDKGNMIPEDERFAEALVEFETTLTAYNELTIDDTASEETIFDSQPKTWGHATTRTSGFSPNGRMIITANYSGQINVWGVVPQTLAPAATEASD